MNVTRLTSSAQIIEMQWEKQKQLSMNCENYAKGMFFLFQCSTKQHHQYEHLHSPDGAVRPMSLIAEDKVQRSRMRDTEFEDDLMPQFQRVAISGEGHSGVSNCTPLQPFFVFLSLVMRVNDILTFRDQHPTGMSLCATIYIILWPQAGHRLTLPTCA